MKRLILMLAVIVGVAYVGCKEGDNDRCQVNSDCKDGVCNAAEGVCSTDNNAMFDALGPDDAPPPDAAADAP